MSHTIIMAIYTSLAIVGKVLVIMCGMSLAGSRHEEHGQDTSEQIPSREICPEEPFLGDGAKGGSAGELTCGQLLHYKTTNKAGERRILSSDRALLPVTFVTLWPREGAQSRRKSL